MASDFPLTPDPTFTAKVDIPVPGKKPLKLEIIFKHRGVDELKQFMEQMSEFENDTETVMEIATGWDHKLPFERDNVEKLVKGYIGSAGAIITKYLQENSGARLGNSAR